MGYIFTAETVDPEFAGCAIETEWKNGEPLLRRPLPSDEVLLYAVDSGIGYELVDPKVSLRDLSRLTYGEHFESFRDLYHTYDDFCENEHGEVQDPMEAIEPEYVLQGIVGPFAFPSGSAFLAVQPYLDAVGPRAGVRGREVLAGEGGADFIAAMLHEVHNPVPYEKRHGPYLLGFVIAHEGPMPGSDYVGIEVSGPIGLSCLQHVLDRAGAGIRIELPPAGFDVYDF